MKLIQEAALDDQFNTQLGKIQEAVSKLNHIVATMTAPGSSTKPVKSQGNALRQVARDLTEFGKILP